MKTDLPEIICEYVVDNAESYLDAMSLLNDAAASWKNGNEKEIEIGLEKIKTARNLFSYCGAHEEMQWIVYAVEMQLFRAMKELWDEEEKKKRNLGGNVYFLQSQETGLIKIGFSKQPKARTKNIMIAHPEESKAIGFIPGSQRTEHSIHKAFSNDRKRGEWFSPSDELVKFIGSFCSPVPLHGAVRQIEA